MSLADWWRSFVGEPDPEPPAILTNAEVAERVKAYAAANGLRSGEPADIKLERQMRNHKDPLAGSHYVYTMHVGSTRAAAFVDVDAFDGSVLSWRQPPR